MRYAKKQWAGKDLHALSANGGVNQKITLGHPNISLP
jgi:hypothetical protein